MKRKQHFYRHKQYLEKLKGWLLTSEEIYEQKNKLKKNIVVAVV